jgi:hypothetical protein
MRMRAPSPHASRERWCRTGSAPDKSDGQASTATGPSSRDLRYRPRWAHSHRRLCGGGSRKRSRVCVTCEGRPCAIGLLAGPLSESAGYVAVTGPRGRRLPPEGADVVFAHCGMLLRGSLCHHVKREASHFMISTCLAARAGRTAGPTGWAPRDGGAPCGAT